MVGVVFSCRGFGGEGCSLVIVFGGVTGYFYFVFFVFLYEWLKVVVV